MKELRALLVCILAFAFSMIANAQLTDAQVRDYVSSRTAAGMSSDKILKNLVNRGATLQQIQNLDADITKSASSDDTPNASQFSRDREVTGETQPDTTGTSYYSKTKKVFGRDIFRAKALSFQSSTAIPTPQNYNLGAGDELIVDVYGASQSSNKYKIGPDGTVTIPRIGPVAVSGMTVEQAQARVRKAMGVHYQNSTIKVTVGQTRSITINVMGEVRTPGTYTLSAFATVFNALYMAGGINDLGTLRDIKVARNGRVISVVDIYQYILNGRLAGNVMLHDNDVIIVGTYDNLVNISGNIKRPMWYEMKKNESLNSLLKYAGGFTGDAYTKNVRVERRAGDKLSVYNVEEFDFNSFMLADGDNVSIDENEQKYENLVVLEGAVLRPGHFELNAVNTVRGLIEAAGGLSDDAQTNRAVLVRMNPDHTRRTITVDLFGIMDGSKPDMKLENEDVLTIASVEKLRGDQIVNIEGEVYNPGTFPYAENTTIEDLITKAGGLTESASLLNVEVARRIVDKGASTDSDRLCETFTFNLASGLEVDKSNSFTLMPYDHVYVRRSPVYNEQKSVKIKGEVMFAGNYVLDDQDTRISDVVKRAGGLKSKASIHDARLVRKMDSNELAQRKILLKKASEDGDPDKVDADDKYKSEDAQYKIEADTTYTVGFDLQKAMDKPGSSDDVVLRDGDIIVIPEYNSTVKINGEVFHANTVSYKEGKRLSYYINEAGGYTKKAQSRKTYIIYANGQVSRASKGKVEPGCEIVVPAKPEKKSNAENVTRYVSIITAVATLGAVLVSIFK